MSRMGVTIGDRCLLLSGNTLPIVDDLLTADYSFCVVFDCLDLDQKHEMKLHSFVHSKTVRGIEFMYTQRANKQTRWVTDQLDEMADTFEMERMTAEALKIRQKLPDLMNHLFDQIVCTGGLFAEICKLAHGILPDTFKTLFILDRESSASIRIPVVTTEEHSEADSTEILATIEEQLKVKVTSRSYMMTHITVANANSFCVCAYNDLFLEEAQKCGILLKNAPNEWCCRYGLLFPSVPAWEREMMHPWLPTQLLFRTELSECVECKDTQRIVACKECDWARLCKTCTHDRKQCEVMHTYKNAIKGRTSETD